MPKKVSKTTPEQFKILDKFIKEAFEVIDNVPKPTQELWKAVKTVVDECKELRKQSGKNVH